MNKLKLQQLTLNLYLRDDATLANFYSGDNDKLLALLHSFTEHAYVITKNSANFVYLWGTIGSGRSHLLMACNHEINKQGGRTAYLSMVEHKQLKPYVFENLERLSLLCIDDIDAIVGQLNWEKAILHCFDELLASGGRLMIAANATPQALNFVLPDLKSRLSGGIVYQVHTLSDEQKINALQMRAKLRGLTLADHVAKFIMNHYVRDAESLFTALDSLDKASLQEQRRLTIPFVKDVLGSGKINDE